jgi:hypothetical protein
MQLSELWHQQQVELRMKHFVVQRQRHLGRRRQFQEQQEQRELEEEVWTLK